MKRIVTTIMKIFFDTEFTGLHKDTTLISIGCVDEAGRTFYAELTDYDKSQVDDWIQENVIDNLYLKKEINLDNTDNDNWKVSGNKSFIKKALTEWLENYQDVQFISDVYHYDMVLLIDIFGTAFDLPDNVSASCHDINQDIAAFYSISEREAFDKSREEILTETIPGDKHNSLYDAKVIKRIYYLISEK